MKPLTRAFAFALALLWSNVAGAMPVILGIEGYTFDNPGGLFDHAPISAYAIYDSEATGPASPPNNPVDPFPTQFSQSFVSTGYPYGVFGTVWSSVGPLHFASSGVTIEVSNDASHQAVTPCHGATEDIYGISSDGGAHFIAIVHNCDSTAYDVSDYPMKVPPPPVVGTGPGQFLNDFQSDLSFFDGQFGGNTYFVVTRIYRVVPEPGTLGLLGLGLVGLAASRRRKQ